MMAGTPRNLLASNWLGMHIAALRRLVPCCLYNRRSPRGYGVLSRCCCCTTSRPALLRTPRRKGVVGIPAVMQFGNPAGTSEPVLRLVPQRPVVLGYQSLTTGLGQKSGGAISDHCVFERPPPLSRRGVLRHEGRQSRSLVAGGVRAHDETGVVRSCASLEAKGEPANQTMWKVSRRSRCDQFAPLQFPLQPLNLVIHVGQLVVR